MTGRLRPLAVTAFVAATWLTGCASDTRAFDDLSSLAESVAGEGVPCDGVDPKNGSDLVSEIGSCKGSDVTLYLFDDAGAMEDWKMVGAIATPALVGSNWAVTGDRQAVERIADGLGGEMARTYE